jgi:hypothetical protein
MGENIMLEKSYKFALRAVKLYKYLTKEKKEFVLSKRLLADGPTSGRMSKPRRRPNRKPASSTK